MIEENGPSDKVLLTSSWQMNTACFLMPSILAQNTVDMVGWLSCRIIRMTLLPFTVFSKGRELKNSNTGVTNRPKSCRFSEALIPAKSDSFVAVGSGQKVFVSTLKGIY